jgi:hypothetical protein
LAPSVANRVASATELASATVVLLNMVTLLVLNRESASAD